MAQRPLEQRRPVRPITTVTTAASTMLMADSDGFVRSTRTDPKLEGDAQAPPRLNLCKRCGGRDLSR